MYKQEIFTKLKQKNRFDCPNLEERPDSQKTSMEDLESDCNATEIAKDAASKHSSAATLADDGASSNNGSDIKDGRNPQAKQNSINIVTPEFIESTILRLLRQADQAVEAGLPHVQIEKLILEETGRCLTEIADIVLPKAKSNQEQKN